MVDTQIETPVHKCSMEIVDRATSIITKLGIQMDKCCPACKDLIKEILQK